MNLDELEVALKAKNTASLHLGFGPSTLDPAKWYVSLAVQGRPMIGVTASTLGEGIAKLLSSVNQQPAMKTAPKSDDIFGDLM